MKLLSVILLSFFRIYVMAQNNIVPNSGFENGNYNGGGLLGCNYATANDPIKQFNQDVDDWFVAKHSVDKGYQQNPDWIDIFVCPGNYENNMCKTGLGQMNLPITLPSNRFVHLESSYVGWPKKNKGYTHEAIRAGLKQKIEPNTTYIFRIKYAAQTSNSGYTNSTKNHLRVFFTKWAENWNSNSNNNQKYEPITINKVVDIGNINSCNWRLEEAQFVTPNKIKNQDLDLSNIVLYVESGGFVIDDIELFKKCPNEMLIQNKTYDGWFYGAVGNSFPPLVERANGTLKAGRNVNSNLATGDVVIQHSAQVHFNAGTKIELLPGFRTETGAKFTAEIAACPYPRIGSFEEESVVNQDWIFDSGEEETEGISSFTGNSRQIEIIPNPSTNGQFNLSGLQFSTFGTVTVTNILGETILRHTITSSPNHPIDLSTHSKGIYFVKVQSGEEFTVHKIIFQ